LVKALFNHTALGLAKMLPARIMQHILFLLRMNPEITDRWGHHLRPIHYYEPLPDFSGIHPTATRRRRQSLAVDFKLDEQVALLRRLAERFHLELAELAHEPHGFNFDNDYFAGLDAAMYYALIRDLRPQQIIEIGSGYSTRIANQALQKNRREGNPGKLTCVEPFPQPRLTEAKLDIELIEQPVESLDLEFFSRLKNGDILFIDSSHAVKFGGDVCREFLEILPALPVGVTIHIHDIFFPYDYPAEWLIEKRIAFNEQYLLEAFLAYNPAFMVIAANHWLCLDYPDEVERLMPGLQSESSYNGHGSFWMYKVG
jgi:hypothetical protein